MTKPFELKALTDKLLASLKSVAHPAGEAILDWTSESCALHSNAIVKGIGAVVVATKPVIMQELDKALGINVPAPVVAVAEAPKAIAEAPKK